MVGGGPAAGREADRRRGRRRPGRRAQRAGVGDPSGLQWEFTAGSDAAHLLVVTSAGDSALRSLAERWRRASPPPDEIFGFAAARPGNPGGLSGTLEIDGHELDLDLLRFAAEYGR